MEAVEAARDQLDVGRHVAEVEELGYTVVPGAIPLDLCARARAHMDSLLPPPPTAAEKDVPGTRYAHHASHPIPGSVMAELCSAPAVLAMASSLCAAPVGALRLSEQVLIRTDPRSAAVRATPPPPMDKLGWHCDMVFPPSAFRSRPRHNYFQMFAVFNDVLPGAAATCVIPRSHHRILAAVGEAVGEECTDPATMAPIRQKIIDNPSDYGIDTSTGVELPAAAGSLVIFLPFCLHSGSDNRGDNARYVCVQSFYHHADAQLLQRQFVETKYLRGFHSDMHQAIPRPLRQLLRGGGLWGEALAPQLAQFRERGFFISPEPLVPAGVLATMCQHQCEIEPLWAVTDYPPGLNRLAVQFLLVLKACGEELHALIESEKTLKLASALLEDDAGQQLPREEGIRSLVIEACGMGEVAEWVDEPAGQQVEWHSDYNSRLAFRYAIDAQGPGTPNATLRVLPGSQHQPYEAVAAELQALEAEAAGGHSDPAPDGKQKKKPNQMYARHPQELPLDPGSTLIWNPSCWHATTPNSAQGRRRTVGWNYGRSCRPGHCDDRGARTRDREAVKWVFAGQWEGWPEARQRLWGLLGQEEKEEEVGACEAKL